MLLLYKVSFSVINNVGTPSSELQINYGAEHINSNINCCIKMKPILINMDYCLLQLDALKIFLGDPSTWGRKAYPNFNFFSVNPQI